MREPTDAELREFGLRREDYEEDLEEIPFTKSMYSHWELFQALSTQWREGFNGPTGIDYNVLPFMFDLYRIEDKEAAFYDLRILEAETLSQIRKMNQ